MINLKVSTEYNFGVTYGRIQKIVDNCKESALAITDPNTFGHVKFYDACKKANIKPLLGLKLSIVDELELMEKQLINEVIIIAKNNEGLQELYQLNTKANQNFYYIPRLDWDSLIKASEDIFIIVPTDQVPLSMLTRKNVFVSVSIADTKSEQQMIMKMILPDQLVVIGDNYYPTTDDLEAYQLLIQHHEDKSSPMHIINESDVKGLIPNIPEQVFQNAIDIADACNIELPTSGLPKFETNQSIMDLCLIGAEKRGLDLTQEYMDRLTYEVDLIQQKEYEDYFYIISDLVIYAKKHMLVGPSRGSSAGSLVCYLMFITDVDPIAHGLIFERFIDLNRDDLPDIDIDFQDTKRYMVFDYLKEKYGNKNVGIIGTVLTMQNRSALSRVAEGLNVPLWEIEDLKAAIVKRSSGDARAGLAVKDTLEGLDVGKKILKKYPAMTYAGDLEGHASHFGKHAAGIVLSELPIEDYCSQTRDGVCQLDKKDAEKINLLKIDVLGLRTLSVIQDCLDMVDKDRQWLLDEPLDFQGAWDVLNQRKFSGIFQFEGFALQSLTDQMTVENFNDIVCITSLARPGPLQSGNATEFVKSRIGKREITYLHDLMIKDTEETLGCIVYQEQVMNIGRNVGLLSWEDVSNLRKAMSKSLGEEFFNKYWEKFEKGANSQGMKSDLAKDIWDSICTFGSWAFNKSHAVSYGLISYWCCLLKSKFPIEFYCACLKHSNGDEQSVKLLREFSKAGGEFTPFDQGLSEMNWSIKDDKLVGGFTSLKGIGEKKAIALIAKLEEGKKLTPGQVKTLDKKITPFDRIFECEERFEDIYNNPKKHKVVTRQVSRIEDIQNNGTYVFIGKLKDKNIRDANELGNVQKRGGKQLSGPTQYMNFVLEDDTGSLLAKIGRYDFAQLGKPLLESVKEGQYIIWKGTMKRDFRLVHISKWRLLEDE